MYFAYLVACRPNVLIYRSWQKIWAEVYRPACFCRLLMHHQHLPRIIDSYLLAKVTLTEANVYFAAIYVPSDRLFLGGSSTSSSEEYHRQICTLVEQNYGATCTTVHISRLLIAPSWRKRKGAMSGLKQPRDPTLFAEHPPSEVGEREVVGNSLGARRL